jgi:hypothetical protein
MPAFKRETSTFAKEIRTTEQPKQKTIDNILLDKKIELQKSEPVG